MEVGVSAEQTTDSGVDHYRRVSIWAPISAGPRRLFWSSFSNGIDTYSDYASDIWWNRAWTIAAWLVVALMVVMAITATATH